MTQQRRSFFNGICEIGRARMKIRIKDVGRALVDRVASRIEARLAESMDSRTTPATKIGQLQLWHHYRTQIEAGRAPKLNEISVGLPFESGDNADAPAPTLQPFPDSCIAAKDVRDLTVLVSSVIALLTSSYYSDRPQQTASLLDHRVVKPRISRNARAAKSCSRSRSEPSRVRGRVSSKHKVPTQLPSSSING